MWILFYCLLRASLSVCAKFTLKQISAARQQIALLLMPCSITYTHAWMLCFYYFVVGINSSGLPSCCDSFDHSAAGPMHTWCKHSRRCDVRGLTAQAHPAVMQTLTAEETVKCKRGLGHRETNVLVEAAQAWKCQCLAAFCIQWTCICAHSRALHIEIIQHVHACVCTCTWHHTNTVMLTCKPERDTCAHTGSKSPHIASK